LPDSTVTCRCPLAAHACSIRSASSTESDVSSAAFTAVSFPWRPSARSSFFSLTRSTMLRSLRCLRSTPASPTPWRVGRSPSVPATLAPTAGRATRVPAQRTSPIGGKRVKSVRLNHLRAALLAVAAAGLLAAVGVLVVVLYAQPAEANYPGKPAKIAFSETLLEPTGRFGRSN